MRGGKGKSKKGDVNLKLKFMKAGKADKIGIIETENSRYYSESTSIEEGLCE
jgi:hypothetical protein